jgi:N-acetylmuramoyl-L-alanine amidase
VLSLPPHSLKLTALSSFVVIDETAVHQMPEATLWKDQTVWIPVQCFLPLINHYLPEPVKWNDRIFDQNKPIVTSQSDKTNMESTDRSNIQSVEWSKKLNGLLITFTTTKTFNQSELALWKNKQWLYLTVSGGLPSSHIQTQLNQLTNTNFIRKALLFQHQKSIQFSFQLTRDIDGQEVVYDEPRNQIQLIIRVSPSIMNEPVKKDTIKTQSVVKQDKQWKIDKIVIDAGHGGKDPGAVGKGGTKEKTVTLAIALKLGKLIEDKTGISVAYTRSTDEFISLKNRTKFANNQNAKLFISIHCNASKRRSAAGFETFFLSPSRNDEAQSVAMLENEAIQFEENRHEYGDFTNEKFILASMMQSVFVRESEELADFVQKGLAQKMTIKNRSVSQGPFYVLMGASMPSILVEAAFISNKSEEKFLKSEKGQKAVAEGIFLGLKKFIDSANKN